MSNATESTQETQDFHLTGEEMKRMTDNGRLIREMSRLLNVPRERIVDKIEAMVAERDRLKEELCQL